MSKFSSRVQQLGQGMTEYIIIVALIAVAAIGIYSMFGQTLREQMGGMAQDLSGQANTGIAASQGSAAAGIGDASTQRDLGNYNNQLDQ